jgi:hypothetical protein
VHSPTGFVADAGATMTARLSAAATAASAMRVFADMRKSFPTGPRDEVRRLS